MRKILTALVAAVTIAGAAIATPTTADARWGGRGHWHGGWHGGGWHGGGAFLGGLAAGAIIGGAVAAAPYGYYYPGYAAPYTYYAPTCAWRNVWTAYGWRRVCY
jgi:hypothetical protein